MKKLHTLFFIASFFMAGFAGAQIRKGAILLGGSISGYTQKSTNNTPQSVKQNGLSISPVFGKAIRDNLVFGGSLSFSSQKIKNSPSTQDYARLSSYGAGVFLRKYKTIGKSGFAAFIQGDFRLGYLQQKNQSTPINNAINGTKEYSVGVSAYPGLSYAISRKVQLETGFANLLSLNFFTAKTEASQGGVFLFSSKTNGVNLNTNLNNFGSSLYLGFRILLNKS
jgi:hypothetical protein